ncbi:MAG TPA: hypothetical protein VNT75_12350, partial [Symbiobacteriaceae bacterium]|nr:hypothetical protein [Symbiobacteriaceae bacterium]
MSNVALETKIKELLQMPNLSQLNYAAFTEFLGLLLLARKGTTSGVWDLIKHVDPKNRRELADVQGLVF